MSYHFGDDLLDFVDSSDILRAAKQLVLDERVLRVRQKAEAGGRTKVTGMVEGDFGYYFPARLTLTPEGDGVETYACDCRDFRADRTLCVHCTALILYLEQEQPVPLRPVTRAPSAPAEPEAASSEPEAEAKTAEPEEPSEPFVPQEMEITLGTDDETGEPLIWRPNNTAEVFHTNTGVIGTMGTGKTQFTKGLITQLVQNQSRNFDGQPLGILIFDYKGDYNESKADFVQAVGAKIYRPYHLPFSPLALSQPRVFKPLLPTHVANTFKDTLSRIYHLGPKQQKTLLDCIVRAYAKQGIFAEDPATWRNTPPTFGTVYDMFKKYASAANQTDSLGALMDKLESFQFFEREPRKTRSLFELLQGVVVLDLSGFDSDVQDLIVAITLDLFYSQMQTVGSSLTDGALRQATRFILVDEADHFMQQDFPSLRKILKEGREFGVGTILSTQFLDHFTTGSDNYSKYVLTWVVHNVADMKKKDVEYIFRLRHSSAEVQTQYDAIKELEKHHSIVKIGNEPPRTIRDVAFWELWAAMQQQAEENE